MISKLLCTDVLAIRCVNNLIFVGIGSTLHIFDGDTHKLEEKINCLYPYNIHGIVEGPNNNLAVFGANFLCFYNIYKKHEALTIKEGSIRKYLNDWIITTNWFVHKEYNCLAVLLAHNNVCLLDTFNECYKDIWCEEKCILYAGSIVVKNNQDLIIFSGTVFQEILIWEVNHTSVYTKRSILHRLQGHNGVIFSVIYDPTSKLICSTSDDRTVRLWTVNYDEPKDKDDVNWKEAKIKLIRTMFGHTARVWRSVIKNETLITIGEDSLICNWSLDGKLLNKICAHHGAAIWSIDISDDNKNVYTGGADGAVYTWSLVDNYFQRAVLLPTNHTSLPKYVSYLNNDKLLVFNEDGNLFIVNRLHSNLIQSLYLERYSTYCVMEVSLCRCYICFASKDGYVTIYKEAESVSDTKLERILEENIMDSQIFSIQWLQNNNVIACGLNGILKIFGFDMEGSIIMRSICLLPQSRERWLTAAIIYEELMVCGDRAGNMHVYDRSELHDQANIANNDNKPIQTFTKVHGNIGIQNFIVLGSKLISAGRDGMLKLYEFKKHENKKLLHTLHKEKMPMDWISGSLKTPDDIFILGFKEVEFIIYSMFHRRTITRIPCGGGHRSWDCMLLDKLITFLYIRNKQVHVSDFSLSSMKSPVLLNGFHTKEVYCVNPILKIDHNNIFLSGGEDGTLRVTSISSKPIKNDFSFETLGIFNGHISSIKSIASLNLQSNSSCNKHLVFSGGGRAQIKVWEIDLNESENVLQGISCHDITSHMLYGSDRLRKKQWQESSQSYIMQPETRYMDIAIYCNNKNIGYILLFVACADGFVRIFLYDIDTRYISLKVNAKCVDRCITKISILTYKERVIALTMSTDGICRFIDFTDTVSKILKVTQNEDQEFQNCTSAFQAKLNLHQSGINSFDIKMIEKDEYLLATGGDDNLFNLIRFKICSLANEKELNILLLSKWNTSTEHYTQITGIKFHDENKIVSVGLDQQIIIYDYHYSNSTLSVKVLKKIYTHVTDASGLTLWCTPKCGSVVCAYGKGFEILQC
ncbi:WD repeat-containing protein 6 [Hylaeus volcanicus]|uniref:WD repeat-containing protein 6 n=1 Tax=Hylaeus volcanicus TaxID=313075 RepID=UPI0023B7AC1E|nr:WD repeat-containing protein 6 [Hylaeus volcanicus]XP_053970888.1 WD repeat-containing protein 6 [Hylaeus volcanicus]XP_053970889.1 WD repeat-containing protein 6 [Hylaeus volcanicus]